MLADLRVVLVSPKGPANVGAVARACANFETTSLVVVSPRCNPKDDQVLQASVLRHAWTCTRHHGGAFCWRGRLRLDHAVLTLRGLFDGFVDRLLAGRRSCPPCAWWTLCKKPWRIPAVRSAAWAQAIGERGEGSACTLCAGGCTCAYRNSHRIPCRGSLRHGQAHSLSPASKQGAAGGRRALAAAVSVGPYAVSRIALACVLMMRHMAPL